MFLLSVRARKRRVIPLILTVALMAAMLIASLFFPASRTMVHPVSVSGEEDLAAHLETLGYAVTLPAAEVRDVRLPDVFDGALSDYEALQQQAGFSLEAYAGQPAVCFTFALVGYADGDGAAAHLYTCDGRLIGGDITAADGTLFPLTPASPTTERT